MMIKNQKCYQCGTSFPSDEEGHCEACMDKYGEHLLKAAVDPFDYAFGLKSGAVIKITCANIDIKGDWVIFPTPCIEESTLYMRDMNRAFDRGLQVRLSEIVWVADAPNGS